MRTLGTSDYPKFDGDVWGWATAHTEVAEDKLFERSQIEVFAICASGQATKE